MMRGNWVETELDKACGIYDHLRKPINSKERKKRIEGKKKSELYPYYGATGQVGFIDDYLTDGEYVLIGEDGAPFLDYTKDIAYMINGKTWVNNHAHILLSKFNNKFLLHYLNQFNFYGFVSGTTRLKLTQGSLKNIPVRIAPLPEQRAIVAKIEKLFSDLDNGIANLKAAKAKLDIYRQALLKKAFEGELTKEWREKNSAPSVSTSEKKGNLPEGWQWVTIDEFLYDTKKGITTGPFGTSLKKNEHATKGIPVLGIENIGEAIFKMPNKIFVTPEKAGSLQNFRVIENDIIISRSGTVGEICSVPKYMEGSLISTNLIKVRLNLKKISPKFFVYLFHGGNVREQVKELCKGSTRVFLNQRILKSLRFPFCDIQEQHAVVAAIESRLSVCDKLAESIDQSLEKSEALRQSILKKAFTGNLLSQAEVEACRQEADWEPADKLLKRIQKDKAVGAKNATTGKIRKANNP